MPTPSEKRPGISCAAVAAAWATIAGWIRWVGQVTPVISSRRSVRAAIAPSVPQTNGLSPCASTQGWKWSEIPAKENPAASARSAWETRVGASNSSLERL